MTSDEQGTGQPDPGEPPAPPADAPTEAVPPAPAPPPELAPAPPPELAPAPPATQWEAPPAAAPAPPPAAPAAPASPPPQAAQAAPPQWGAPPPQQPAPTWGPPPAGAPVPQQPAGWGPGAPAAAPGGAPPVDGTWNPQPATKSSNGCLKGCIIVGIILLILVAVVVIGLFWLGNQFVNDLGVDPNSGELKQCELISGNEIDDVFGGDGAEVIPMGGIIDVTIGAILDKRLLGDASDCWILTSGTEVAVTGRIARQESINASGDFQAAKAKANEGKFFGGDVSGIGDEAFCTGASEQSPSFGVLVRQGGSLVYVSLIDPGIGAQGNWQTTDDGVLISPDTCELAGQVAAAVLR